MKKKAIIWATALIIFLNLPLWDFFLCRNYTYTNIDGSFQYEEMSGKGGSEKGLFMKYGGFLATHQDKDLGDNRLFRTFTIQPWRFWEWRQMLMHIDRFELPYLKVKK